MGEQLGMVLGGLIGLALVLGGIAEAVGVGATIALGWAISRSVSGRIEPRDAKDRDRRG